MKVVYRQIPQIHPENLLDSYLEYLPEEVDAPDLARKEVLSRQYPRDALSEILFAYNQDESAFKLLEKESVCVVTGQQLGYQGGPLYTLLKGISAILIAQEMDAIPIFWLATEDHDIAEINHTTLLNEAGNLEKQKLSLPSDPYFVEDLQMPGTGESFVQVMGQILRDAFKGTHLLFIEPKHLRGLSQPIYEKEIKERKKIRKILLQSDGGDILKFTGDTNLFYKDEKSFRKRLTIDDESKWLEFLAKHPEKFSSNAALRTVVQSSLIPTMAYVAGPTEMSYFRQLKEYHHFHQIKMPWLYPRISATLIDQRGADILSRAKANPWDPINISGKEGHYLNNLLHPKGRLQERVLGWSQFYREGLVQEILEKVNWRKRGHNYIWLD